MSETLNWGILGTGSIAGVLADAINASQTGTLLAVGSRSQAGADKFGDKYKVPKRYPSYDALLADPAVQAVYISLPNHLHAEWTIKCAVAGKHILNEKPFSTNHAEAMAMIEAARRHDVFLMEAFMYRCHPQTRKLVELIKAKAIGELRLIQCNFSFNMGEQLNNIRLRNDAAGGGITDVGAYCMSMARLLAGAAVGKDFSEPVEVKGAGHIGAKSRVDEYAVAALKFPGARAGGEGEIIANLACGCEVNTPTLAAAYGSEGHIIVNNPWFPGNEKGQATILLHKAGKVEEIDTHADRKLYVIEVDTVAENIANRQAPSPCMTWADSLGNMAALDRWRSEIGLVYEPERSPAIDQPVARRPLARQAQSKMKYGKVAGIDKPVSRLVMGSMVISTDSMPFSNTLLDHFFEIGGTCIDTAYVYGGGGRAEAGVGKWIATRGVRDQIVLIGKGAATTGATPELVTRELLETLYRLGVDHLDLYMMHRDNTELPVGAFVDVLNEHKDAGRISAFGGSNWTTGRIAAANDYAKSKGLQGFSASSPNFSLAEWNEPTWSNCISASDKPSRDWYRQSQLPLFAWSSQANGFFTGRFDLTHPAALPFGIARVWYNANNVQRAKRVDELAKKKGITPIQVALAYVLCQPLNIFALIGPQTLEETRTSAQALDVELSAEELAWLNLEK